MKTMTKQARIWGERYRLEIKYGLHYIRGNSSPYFSITADAWKANKDGERDGRYRDCQMGGCLHEEILKAAPELAPVVALHLSDMDGAPMHAEANGWYNLAGYLSYPKKQYAQYHVGNSKRNFEDGYREPTRAECLELFARYCRLTLAEAKAIAKDVILATGRTEDAERARKRWAEICETLRPRWKAEATKVIADFGLEVYGDKWEATA